MVPTHPPFLLRQMGIYNMQHTSVTSPYRRRHVDSVVGSKDSVRAIRDCEFRERTKSATAEHVQSSKMVRAIPIPMSSLNSQWTIPPQPHKGFSY